MRQSGSLIEYIVFGLRVPVLFVLLLLTVFFAYHAADIQMDSSLRKMVPLDHEYIKNLYRHKGELSLGNDIRIIVENKRGTIFEAEFLQTLKQISDEAFYLPGVNKGKMKSLWTPNVRWTEVDVDGLRGGEVMPNIFDGSPETIAEVESNVLKSGQIGYLVADDLKSTVVYLPLLDYDEKDPNSSKINYKAFSDQIEERIRDKFQTDDIKIHIVGFAKKIGDLIDAAQEVALFFLFMLVVTFCLLLGDSRCPRTAIVILSGAVMSVVWQLGLVSLMHKAIVYSKQSDTWTQFIAAHPTLEPIQFGIDPYSMLIPFLIFAISVSHGVQYTNDMALRVAKNQGFMDASKCCFQALFLPGLLALVSDAFGFITLWFIDIGVIREMAVTASVGVAVIIITKLIFVPIVLSYVGVGQGAVKRQLEKQNKKSPLLNAISQCSTKPGAILVIAIASVLAIVGFDVKQDLKVGDLSAGAPELHADSRYNLDNKFVTTHYSVSADVLVVMVETPVETCSSYVVMNLVDQFLWIMENVEGVESALSHVTVSKRILTGMNEGNLKWSTLSSDPAVLGGAMANMPAGLINSDCSLLPVIIYLEDHKAETLDRVVKAVETFAQENDDDTVAKFVLASGNAGVEAATNQTIKAAELRMLILVYSVVSFMVWVAFRSLRAVVCIVLPLMLTSILCEALMTVMGIGIKVATLPVIALGVGIGVDYGIYIYAKLQHFSKEGFNLQPAYYRTLQTTGRSVVFTCLTLSVSVGTWIFSGIRFQADMGVLLTFMFLWNMVGALFLLPALARLLRVVPTPLA